LFKSKKDTTLIKGLFLVTVSLLTIYVKSATGEVFSPKSFDLKNGLKVVVVVDHRAPVVTHMVWYKVGSADEPVGQSGIAHFLEHLMFKGTKRFKAGESHLASPLWKLFISEMWRLHFVDRLKLERKVTI